MNEHNIAIITCISAIITGIGIWLNLIQNFSHNRKIEMKDLNRVSTNFNKNYLEFSIPDDVPWRIVGIEIPGYYCLKKKDDDEMWAKKIEYGAPYKNIRTMFNSKNFDPKRSGFILLKLSVVSTLNSKKRCIKRRLGFYGADGLGELAK